MMIMNSLLELQQMLQLKVRKNKMEYKQNWAKGRDLSALRRQGGS
jgi:hypothetical protein